VLPGYLWLPQHLAEKYGHEFDVCGFDRIVAIDNARDLQSEAVTAMFLMVGAIVLCIPPKRGDLKGKVERTIRSLEQMFFQALDGYISNVDKFLSPEAKELRKRAYAEAKLTVAEFEELLLLAILAYNKHKHPDDNRPRIQVYREGLQAAPPFLPVGRKQIDTIFSMTYSATVTREGAQAETWHYNSRELQQFCRVGAQKVLVCIPVDDVRNAIIYHPELTDPLLVPLTTHIFPEATPLEYAKLVLNKLTESSYRIAPDGEGEALTDRYFQRVDELQRSPRRVKGAAAHTATTAAAQAANMPPVDPPKPRAATDAELSSMFGPAPEDA